MSSRLTLALVLSAIVAFATLTSCKPKGQVGDACTVTGDGFNRQDSCATMCVDWEITCPSGGTIAPHVCSGAVCGAGGACPDGQECVQVDSFAANARCMPVSVCGAATLPSAPGLPGQGGEGERPLDYLYFQF